ncbi:hypothetical protein EK21DRAFT_116274 [Setomelanomma holmii]|uniref:Uncharacterized protein n=1 Tax=Setomelanomma holmii TaxID=210430 RepID=A0A9P4H3F6_9PLEO|nr:hypothetical protein EK21DRAFT_116274 [Setomelanomma holmii]
MDLRPSLGWLSGDSKSLPLEDTDLTIARPISEIIHLAWLYVSRKLTFDSDALFAFFGVLQSLRDDTRTVVICNISGLPFIPNITADSDRDRYMFVALVREHTCSDDQRVRRPMFPSWSWVGWRGSICWLYQTDFASIEDIYPVMRKVTFGTAQSSLMQSPAEIPEYQQSAVTSIGFEARIVPASAFEGWGKRDEEDHTKDVRL